MRNRFENALMIQEGACNPSGIAHSLVEACRECIAAGVSQRQDPAVRLIVHQLAYLCNVGEIDGATETYRQLTEACQAEGVMTRRYHVLLTREGEAWAIAFGDYDRETVKDERADHRDHDWKARHLKIITTGDSQAEIEAAVAKLNRRQP